MSFDKELQQASERTIEHVENVYRASAIKVWSEIIYIWPVGKPELWAKPENAPKGYTGGSSRANWQVTISRPSVVYNPEEIDKQGAKTVNLGTNKILSVSNPSSFFFTNNAPYSRRIEYDAWSTQMPAGTVRNIANKFSQYVKQNENVK